MARPNASGPTIVGPLWSRRCTSSACRLTAIVSMIFTIEALVDEAKRPVP